MGKPAEENRTGVGKRIRTTLYVRTTGYYRNRIKKASELRLRKQNPQQELKTKINVWQIL
jgi:hypothetical protein